MSIVTFLQVLLPDPRAQYAPLQDEGLARGVAVSPRTDALEERRT